MKLFLTFACACILSSAPLCSQSFNYETTTEKGDPMLLGKINKEGFSSKNYNWFTKNYEAYQAKSEVISSIKDSLSSYTIKAFMGTWCGDSKREVPRFYSILEASHFPLERLTMIAVDRKRETYKQSPGGEHEGLNIHRVPIFILYKDGKEVNRIVERPIKSLEEDLQQIIQGDYTSNYHSITVVNKVLQEMGVEKFGKKSKKLFSRLQPEVKTMYELNTYANVLFSSNKKKEAIAVAELNTLLFPDEARAYESLANKLAQTGDKEAALMYLKKALQLDPENKRYKSAVAGLTQ